MLPTDDDIPEKPVRARFEEAEALRQAGRLEDAARSYDAVPTCLDAESDREAEIALQTLYLKIHCLYELGDAQGTLVGCDALFARYGASEDQKVIGFVADALWLKSRSFSRLGNLEQERMVLRHLIEQYAAEPRARSQVARAMYNEGIHLRDTQQGDEAIGIGFSHASPPIRPTATGSFQSKVSWPKASISPRPIGSTQRLSRATGCSRNAAVSSFPRQGWLRLDGSRTDA